MKSNQIISNLIPLEKALFTYKNHKLFKEDTLNDLSNQIPKKLQSQTSVSEISKQLDTSFINQPIAIKTEKLRKHISHSDDPHNKTFNYHYNICCYTKTNFLFEFKGSLTQEEFRKQTQLLQSYPLHLKLTLFSTEKAMLTREKDFSFIMLYFNELKDKGNKWYKRQKFRSALSCYIQAYSWFKWLEFRDPSRLALVNSNIVQILDKDIICKSSLNNTCEDYDYETSSNSNDAIISILLCLSYCFMEWRDYKNTVSCLNECLEIDENNPIALFRRSQAVLYNMNSKLISYELACNDLKKSFIYFVELSLPIPLIYTETLSLLKTKVSELSYVEHSSIRELIYKGYEIFKNNNEFMYWEHDGKYTINCQIESHTQNLQFKVLKIMKKKYKMIIKYYNETQNEAQLFLAYEEFDNFMIRYKWFKYFHCLDIPYSLADYIKYIINNGITEDNALIDMLSKHSFIRFIDTFKNKKADGIFQGSNFNIEWIKYAIGKVNQDMKMKERLEYKMKSYYGKDDDLGKYPIKKVIYCQRTCQCPYRSCSYCLVCYLYLYTTFILAWSK